jgi:hypothetical protein
MLHLVPVLNIVTFQDVVSAVEVISYGRTLKNI